MPIFHSLYVNECLKVKYFRNINLLRVNTANIVSVCFLFQSGWSSGDFFRYGDVGECPIRKTDIIIDIYYR